MVALSQSLMIVIDRFITVQIDNNHSFLYSTIKATFIYLKILISILVTRCYAGQH